MKEILKDSIFESKTTEKISNHFMEQKQANVKELYLTFLYAITNEIGFTDKKIEFLAKLSNAFGLNSEQLQKKAKGITKEFLTEIIKNFKNTEMGDYLIIDIFILANLDNDFNQETSETIISVLELFNLDEDKLIKLIGKAKYLLKVNKERSEYNNYPVILKNIVSEFITIDDSITYESDTIFINCVFDFTENGKLLFTKGNHVFTDCKLHSPSIDFTGCENIEITNCEITGKVNQDSYFTTNKSNNIIIENCSFKNIDNKEIQDKKLPKKEGMSIFDRRKFGVNIDEREQINSIINFINLDKVILKNCNFINCSVVSSTYKSTALITSNLISLSTINTVNISNSAFLNCSCLSKYKSQFIFIYKLNSCNFSNNKFERCYVDSTYTEILMLSEINSIQTNDIEFNEIRCVYDNSSSDSRSNYIKLDSVNSGRIEKLSFKNCDNRSNEVYSYCPNVKIDYKL